MAKQQTAVLEGQPQTDDNMADLSPEALEARRLASKVPVGFLVNRDRAQQIVDDWREQNPFVKGVLDNHGQQIPMPRIIVHQRNLADWEEKFLAIMQDQCEDTEQEIVVKVKRNRKLKADGAAGVEALDTVLAPLSGNLTIPPTPSR